jgi:protein-tyrosine phosphatase
VFGAGWRRYAPGIATAGVDRPYRILILCTANQCRSPMAAVLLARDFAPRGETAEISSAGALRGGAPAAAGAVDAMARLGLDLSGHESRQMDRHEVEGADLVLGMAREHVRDAVAEVPDAYARAFTLKELVRRGERAPRGAGQPLDEWLTSLATPRAPTDLLGSSPDDDLRDPMGGSTRQFRATAADLEDLTDRLLRVAFPRTA